MIGCRKGKAHTKYYTKTEGGRHGCIGGCNGDLVVRGRGNNCLIIVSVFSMNCEARRSAETGEEKLRGKFEDKSESESIVF